MLSVPDIIINKSPKLALPTAPPSRLQTSLTRRRGERTGRGIRLGGMRRVPVTSGRPLWPWNSFGYIQRQSYSATSVSRPSARYESPANGPISTLPAPLDVPPPRKPGEGIFGYYFKVGKGYLTFYKTGLKNAAWVNPKLASPVLRRWKESEGYKGFHQNNWITRGDLQLLK